VLRWCAGHGQHPGAALTDPKHRLAAEVRRLVEAVATLDADEVHGDTVDDLADRARELADAVCAEPSVADKGGPHLAGGRAAPLEERSPISGLGNPLSPPLTMVRTERGVSASAIYGWAHEGPPNTLHGGWVAAAFDEVLGVAQAATGFTGTLTIRMRAPTPLHTPVHYEGWLDRKEGRKAWALGTATANGIVVGEAEGIFIAPKGGGPVR
jgi:hypothetical protein